ncbi:NIPSNAP family protein [Mucilaginibacter lutimaris]|uniref:NIPSNAP family protein n=1 Tax=Mucilaginibacter lutimaris TaxID=931629 RepID=A0ABW2ZDM4_9SPHI
MSFYKKIFRCAVLLSFFVFSSNLSNAQSAGTGYYYEIKIYHFKTNDQERVLDSYLQHAYLPMLHKKGFTNVGVLKPVETDTADRKIYVFIPFKNWKEIETFNASAEEPNTFAANHAEYPNAAYNKAPYHRIETIILTAFVTRPTPLSIKLTGERAKRIYELRSYESPTEALNFNKVRMFNSGETDLFDRLGFNPVFYGNVIAGSTMPNLMYLTTFNNKADRDKHWDAFGKDAQWKDLSSRKEFQNNVSKADITFLYPTDYSDF